MADRLYDQCLHLLRMAAHANGGDVYRNISLDGRQYEGLHLVWDGPDRLVVVGFCWSQESLEMTRSDSLTFMSVLGYHGVYKKLHVVVFHPAELGILMNDWPAGVSSTSLALEAKDADGPVPDSLMRKMVSLLMIDRDESAPALMNPPDWQWFLTPERINRRLRELKKEKGQLPSELQELTKKLLDMAKAEPATLRERLADYLNRRWEAGRL